MLKKEYPIYVSVSLELPLLSNLSIIENIALIKEVHQHQSREASHKEVSTLLASINMANISHKRVSTCNEYEQFCAMLIRASMMQDATIFIITPLQLFHTKESIADILELLTILKLQERLLFLDLELNIEKYQIKGIACHTIK